MNIAIVYFSLTGNTEKVALEIERQLKEKNIKVSLIRLKGKTGSFIGNSLQALFRVKVEIEEVNWDLGEFDFIFVGSPVWAFSPTPQVNTFLAKCSGLGEKKGAVFVTYHSGTGKERALRIMKKELLNKGLKEVYSFSISNKITTGDRDKLNKKIEFVLTSSPIPYQNGAPQKCRP